MRKTLHNIHTQRYLFLFQKLLLLFPVKDNVTFRSKFFTKKKGIEYRIHDIRSVPLNAIILFYSLATKITF